MPLWSRKLSCPVLNGCRTSLEEITILSCFEWMQNLSGGDNYPVLFGMDAVPPRIGRCTSRDGFSARQIHQNPLKGNNNNNDDDDDDDDNNNNNNNNAPLRLTVFRSGVCQNAVAAKSSPVSPLPLPPQLPSTPLHPPLPPSAPKSPNSKPDFADTVRSA